LARFFRLKTKFSNFFGKKLKKRAQTVLFLSSLAVESLKYSKLASKKLAFICLGSNISGDRCDPTVCPTILNKIEKKINETFAR